MTTVEQQTRSAIRPFRVQFPEESLADLRRRLAATRWPPVEQVQDASQGVQAATMQALCRYWAADYDWRACEARLNALPQFTTEIDGVDIHFVHVKSPHADALPLIVTHPGPARSWSCSMRSVRSRTRPRTAGGPRTRSTSCCRPSLGTASPPSRPRSAGTWAVQHAPGRS